MMVGGQRYIGALAKLRKDVEYHIGEVTRSLMICPMFVLCSVMVCVGGIEVDQLNALCVCGHIRLVWTKHATAGQVHTVWRVFGTSASIMGGTD